MTLQESRRKQLLLAMSLIPSQPADPEYRDWSCSQNTMARQLIMLGSANMTSSAEYYRFVHFIPKALGRYGDHSFDNGFGYNSWLVSLLNQCLKRTGIAMLALELINLTGVKFGLSTEWLASYMTQAGYRRGNSSLVFRAYGSDNFDETVQVIRQVLANGGGVSALVFFNLMGWHYVSVVEQSGSTVTILETDGRLYRWSLAQFDCLLNAGLESDFSLAFPEELLRYSVSAVANWITPVNYYNLILIQ